MQPPDFIYNLMHKTSFLKLNNGVVATSGVPSPMPETPDGWQGVSIKYGRSAKYHGLVRSFSTPLQFVKTGAKIIRSFLYKFGFEAELFLVIHKLDKSFGGGWKHKLLYRGELDLSKFEDGEDDINVSIMEGGLIKLFKANENTTYEIPVDEVTVQMDGIEFKQEASWIVAGIQKDSHTLGMPFISQDGISAIGATAQDTTRIANAANELWPSGQAFISSDINPSTVTINWDFIASASASFPWSDENGVMELQLIILKDEESLTSKTILQQFPGKIEALTNKHFTGTKTFTLPPFSRAILYMYLPLYPDKITVTYNAENSSVTAKYNYTHKTTYVKALRPMTIGQRLLDKIAGPGYVFQSNYLQTEWNNLLVTSGDALRGIAGSKLKTSWNDFYDSYNVPANLRLTIKGNIVSLERKSEAYKQTVAVHLGNGKNIVIKEAADHQYNTIEIGYPDVNIEGVNGKYEFNVTHQYSVPDVKKTVKKLSLISKYHGSMFASEILRINLEGKKTTNDSADNEGYFLHVAKLPTNGTTGQPSTYFKLLRNTYTSITGLPSPSTAFNIEISPKRCLINHGDYLRSCFYFNTGSMIRFESSQRNAELKTVRNGVTIEEKANVNIGMLPDPLFIPMIATFETPIPNNIITEMELDPNRSLLVNNSGSLIYGFPIELTIEPAFNPSQETTMLLSPLTDLSQFL